MTPAETILAQAAIVAGLLILAAWIIHGICGAIEFMTDAREDRKAQLTKEEV